MNPALLLAVPAALYFVSQRAKAAAPAPASSPAAPAGKTVSQRMAEAIATHDPAAIRAEAARLRGQGQAAAATELERVAAAIASSPPAAPPLVSVPVVPTPMPTPVANPPVVPTGAPWLAGVPRELQGVTLRRTSPVAYDQRVSVLQARLIELGYLSPPADGKFGPGTESAVKAFQTASNVAPVDGIVGPITLIKLVSAPPKSASSPKPAPAPAPKPATAAPKPAPAPKPATAAPKPAPAPAGKAPTITAALRSSGLLRNGRATGYKAPASSGPAVRDWQQVLFDLGFIKGKPDGKFGAATEAATRAFQAAANSAAQKSGKPLLSVDGIVGPATVARAAEARIMPSGPATFGGDSYFGDDVGGPMYAPLEPLADSPMPGVIPDMAPVAPNPRRALAARLYNALSLAPKGREDRTLVALYQAQEGLKPTGFYGPGVALSLAKTYGIVPPRPLYWTESRTRQSKANYRDAMRVFAERDPQRSEEWRRAGDV